LHQKKKVVSAFYYFILLTVVLFFWFWFCFFLMAALYGKALFCPLSSLQKSLLVLFKDHGDSLHCLEEKKKKAKSGLLPCVYNKSITIVTTVMSQTLPQGPTSVPDRGRAA